MWKTISRGFRETFERGLNLNWSRKVEVGNDGQRTKYYQYYGRVECPLTVCGGQKKEKCQTEGTSGSGTHHQKSYGTYDPFDSWLGAFSCSSAFALGWVLSQPCHWKRWFREKDCPNQPKTSRCIFRSLTRSAVAQPILPPSSPHKDSSENEVHFGPQTAEDALNEAAENFLKVHNSIFGEVENKKAIALIEGPKKDERKAIRLFFSAMKKGYIPAAYNLAQCYELGIGTKQDFHEAAKWYKKAADGGHPAATYNLAVFHAHGWGGLSRDSKKARELLEVAAALGQPDAAAALGLVSHSTPPPRLENVELVKEVPSLEEVSCDPEELFKMAASFEKTPSDDMSQPYLIMQLYKMASELGHQGAKSKYQILQSYDTVGLLSEYLHRGSKQSQGYSSLSFAPLL